MSIDLQVDYTSPILLAAIREAVPACLQELLGVFSVPPLHVEELSDGVRSPADPNAVVDTECAWILHLQGHHPDDVYFAGVEVQDDSTREGVRHFVHIMAGGCRTPLEFALVAAMAVVIARSEGASTSINDGARFFTAAIDCEVDEFVRQLRVAGPFSDIVTAAGHFSRHLFGLRPRV